MHETFDPNAATSAEGIFGLPHKPEDARVVLIPVPWEATVSFGSGTGDGPAAILRASRQVDLFDRDTGRPYESGIAMLPISETVRAWSDEAKGLASAIIEKGGTRGDSQLEQNLERVNHLGRLLNGWVANESRAWLECDKIVGIVGGDHSVPLGAIAAIADKFPGLGILHIDAHADLRAAYEGAEGRTPEGQYYLYQMLRACATVADRKSTFAPTRGLSPTMLQERRERVLAEIPEGSVVRDQRLAALDQLSVDKCEGMGGITIPEAELNGLLKSAALGGDPKARLVQTEAEMWAERRSANANRPGFVRPTLNEAQLDAVKGAFTSRDPEAIALAGNLLTQQFRDVSVRLGTDTEPVDPSAMRSAALLLACEYGYPCGANAQAVLSGCAIQGRCGVASLADYLYYFSASPYEAQAIDRYRAILRQVSDSGDTSGLNFARLPSVINSSTTTTTVVSPGTPAPRK